MPDVGRLWPSDDVDDVDDDESGIYRCGAQSTLVIDFKLKCEHEILVEANTSYTQKKYKYELNNEQVIQKTQS